MLAPVLCSRTDSGLGAVILTVSGPLTTPDHVAGLQHTLALVPRGFSLIIEMDEMTTLSTTGLRGLRDLASSATAEGIRLVIVSESLDVRANLILSDLDSLAPILHNLSQARQVVAAAA
jgi:anti-anti-sigma regulatory factor